MAEIEWADPPQVQTDWARVAATLRTRPGKWARIRVATTDGGLSTRINQGLGAWGPTGSFQARSVAVASGRKDIYARYVGAQGGVE